MTLKYIIPAIPPSNNKFIGRTNWQEYQRTKRVWASYVAAYCRPKPEAPLKQAVVTLCYYFPTATRRDPDNYSGKMILDGLTKAGIIQDDSFGHVRLELEGLVDREKPRTEIEIEERGGEEK